MSEFKYACPVCGQHIKCDSSQAGTKMECPTCFQKITVPQAPSTDDQKFIITGTKPGERPAPNIPEYREVMPENNFPLVAMVIVLVLVCAVGAAVFAFRGKIFESSAAAAPTNEVASGASGQPTPVRAQAPPKPAPAPPPVAPPANDTNWTLNLNAAVIPDATAAGRIHGQDFIIERAILMNGMLILRTGRGGPLESGVTINFSGAQAEALSGESINVGTNASRAAGVTLHWKDGDQLMSGTFIKGYALRLDWGQISGNRLPGKIYLCAPDETKSYVAGTFNADIRKARPKR
jgi:DNA-directed RNA polymerase subunit RPC12/RpoP